MLIWVDLRVVWWGSNEGNWPTPWVEGADEVQNELTLRIGQVVEAWKRNFVVNPVKAQVSENEKYR